MLSTYHTFSINDYYYLYDYTRLAYFQIGKQLFDLLNSVNHMVGNEALDIIQNSDVEFIDDLKELINDGFLFYVEDDLVLENTYIGEIEDKSTINVTICLGSACNLRCDYCYYRENVNATAILNCDDLIRMIEILLEKYEKVIVQIGGGGEPFLYKNQISKLLTDMESLNSHYKAQRVQGVIITNGTVYDEQLFKMLSEHNISIIVSIDGDKDSHNASRKFINGSLTYDEVISTITKILSNSTLSRVTKNIWTASVVTSHTKSLVEASNKFMQIGIKTAQFRLAKGDTNAAGISEHNYQHFIHLYEELFQYLCTSARNGNEKPLLMILNEGDTAGKIIMRLLVGDHSVKRCFAASQSLCVDPCGNVYPCAFLDGISGYEMGEMLNWKPNTLVSKLMGSNIFSIVKCRKCWANTVCGGHCPYHSIKAGLDPLTPDTYYCLITKAIVENAIHLVNVLESESPELYQSVYRFANRRIK